jgi:hypothetical protein
LGPGFNGIKEFGIITAPNHVELPAAIYDLPELQNTDGRNGLVSFPRLPMGFTPPPSFQNFPRAPTGFNAQV